MSQSSTAQRVADYLIVRDVVVIALSEEARNRALRGRAIAPKSKLIFRTPQDTLQFVRDGELAGFTFEHRAVA